MGLFTISWSSFFVFGLAFGMLFTGTFNTIMTKLQDKTESVGSDGKLKEYSHPGFQTFTMFIGESLCLVAYGLLILYLQRQNTSEAKISLEKNTTWFPGYLFILPTLCDLTATTTMNVGLLLTYASVYQMLRGSMVFFTALFSIIFLQRRLKFQQYIGLIFVVLGITIVGLASVLFTKESDKKPPNPAVGNILVILAQLIVATQFVLEEKFLSKYEVPPLGVVGLEGIFGIGLLLIILPFLAIIKINGKDIENSWDAMVMISNSTQLGLANGGSILSVAMFNFFGVSVTKYLSATHRTTIDSCRTLFVWMVSLLLGWETFDWLQLIGFIVLVFGTFTYNDVYTIPGLRYLKPYFKCVGCFPASDESSDEQKPLLASVEESVNYKQAAV